MQPFTSIDFKEKTRGMELKEAYIEKIVCHHFSVDPTKCLINDVKVDMNDIDTDVLKDFFIKPFASQKAEYSFAHAVDLAYNVCYQTVLSLLQGEDFIQCSQKLFRHLASVSTQPSIKDGDVFIAKISDILDNDTYYDGLGIYEIEKKNEFIETFMDRKGNMQFTIKNGFSSNRIDKACLVVYCENMPKCHLIDTSKDTKFWRQDFLGLIPMANSYSQSKAAIQVFQSFVNDKLADEKRINKNEQIDLINRWTEKVKHAEHISINQTAIEFFQNNEMLEMFADYCKVYEERENVSFSSAFNVDKKVVSVPKKVRTIKLDDTVEISLMKTGNFIERGFDEGKGMNYYKLYFSKEK